MADNNKNINPKGLPPDSELLLAYLKREMSNAEKHELEERMLNDGFMADAAEGLSAVNNPLILTELTNQVNQKFNAPQKAPAAKTSPLAVVGNTLAVAASVALLVVAGYFISQTVNNKAENITIASKQEIAQPHGPVNEHTGTLPAADTIASAPVLADESIINYPRAIKQYRYPAIEESNFSEPAYTPSSNDDSYKQVVAEQPVQGNTNQTFDGSTNYLFSTAPTVADNGYLDKYGPASNNVSRPPVKNTKKGKNVATDSIADQWGNGTAVTKDEDVPGYYVNGTLIKVDKDINNKTTEQKPTTPTKANADVKEKTKAESENKNLTKGLEKYNKGEYRSAINDLEDALKNEPGNQKALYSLGMAYKNINKFDNAITTFNKLPATSSYYENALWEKANIYLAKNDDATTISILNSIIKLNGPYKIRAQNMLKNLQGQNKQ